MKRSAVLLSFATLLVMLANPDLRAGDKVEASPPDAFVAEVDVLSDQITKMGDDGKPLVEPSYRSSMLNQFARVRSAVEEKNYRAAIQACENLSQYGGSVAFRKQVKDFTAKLSALAKAEQTEQLAKARELLAELPALCAKTTKALDFQPLADRVQEMISLLGRNASSGSDASLALAAIQEQLSSARSGLREWSTALLAEESGDLAKAIEALNRLGPGYSSSSSLWQNSKELQAKIAALRETLAKQTEQTLQATRAAISKARSAAEGTQLLQDFTRQMERLSRAAASDAFLQQQIEALRNALNNWTRVLLAEEKGDIQQALANLGNLDSDAYATRLDPQLQGIVTAKREALTRRLLDAVPKADDAILKLVAAEVEKAGSLDELIGLRTKLTGLQSSGFSSSRMFGTYQQGEVALLLADLSQLESARQAVESRQFSMYLQAYPVHGPASQHRWKDITRRHYNVLKAQAFAELFQLGSLKLSANETVDQALLKVSDRALEAKEWERALRGLEAYRICLFANQPPPASLADQIDAYRYFIAARNYEKAGEPEQAAACYLRALQAPAEHAPVAAATKEIMRLRKERPDIFDRLRKESPPPLSLLSRQPDNLAPPVVHRVLDPRGIGSLE